MLGFDESKPLFNHFPPEKTVEHTDYLGEIDTDGCSKFDIPEGATQLSVSSYNHYGDRNYSVEFYGPTKIIPNPNYDEQLKNYEELKDKFDKRMVQWELDKKEYDARKAKNEELAEKVLYEKLKRKFEIPNCPSCGGQREKSSKAGLYNCLFCGLSDSR